MKVEIGSSNIGPAIMYHVDVGESLEAVYYPEKYRNHGSDLAFLSHHGYLALIEGVKKIKKRGACTRGCLGNKCFEFTDLFALKASHCQRIRSKQKIVIQKGRSPKYPGPPPTEADVTKHWKRQANYFTQYQLTHFCPEDQMFATLPDEEFNTLDYSYMAFCEWIVQM